MSKQSSLMRFFATKRVAPSSNGDTLPQNKKPRLERALTERLVPSAPIQPLDTSTAASNVLNPSLNEKKTDSIVSQMKPSLSNATPLARAQTFAASIATSAQTSDSVASTSSTANANETVESIDRSSSSLLFSHQIHQRIAVQIRRGDLTREDVDVVVNAANGQLAHGGGVAGALRRAAGPTLQKESDEYVRRHGPLSNGQVCHTGAGDLMAKHVVHAVGPIFRDGNHNESKELADAVYNSLVAAHRLGARSIALPAISSGIFGFPKPLCAEIEFEQAIRFANKFGDKTSLTEIRFTNFDQPTCDVFLAEANRRFEERNDEDSDATEEMSEK